jgi:hypothetical protein
MIALDPVNPAIGCVEGSDGEKLHMITLTLNLQALPVFPMFGPVWIYFSHLYVYLIQGRYAGYLPTISETGVEEFGHEMQFKTFTLVDCTFAMTCLAICFYACLCSDSRIWRALLTFFLVFGFFFNLCIGCCEMIGHRKMHQVAAFSGFVFCLSFEFTVYLMVFNFMTSFAKSARFVFLFFQVPGFLLAGFAECMFQDRNAITWSTVGEYAFLISMFAFAMSFHADLGSMEFVLFYPEETKVDSCS